MEGLSLERLRGVFPSYLKTFLCRQPSPDKFVLRIEYPINSVHELDFGKLNYPSLFLHRSPYFAAHPTKNPLKTIHLSLPHLTPPYTYEKPSRPPTKTHAAPNRHLQTRPNASRTPAPYHPAHTPATGILHPSLPSNTSSARPAANGEEINTHGKQG